MPLSLDDEIFVEKCFQRSLLVSIHAVPLLLLSTRIMRIADILVFEPFLLLGTNILQELEKLISYSGTPTVVWRRTGEICLVAPEFCMLTEWPLEELLGSGRKKYIYEVRIYLNPRYSKTY